MKIDLKDKDCTGLTIGDLGPADKGLVFLDEDGDVFMFCYDGGTDTYGVTWLGGGCVPAGSWQDMDDTSAVRIVRQLDAKVVEQ